MATGFAVATGAYWGWGLELGGCYMEEVQGWWCVWPEIVVARLMVVVWAIAATVKIGQKGRVGVALPQ